MSRRPARRAHKPGFMLVEPAARREGAPGTGSFLAGRVCFISSKCLIFQNNDGQERDKVLKVMEFYSMESAKINMPAGLKPKVEIFELTAPSPLCNIF